MALDRQEIAHRFAHHPPRDEITADAHGEVRELLRVCAVRLNDLLQPSREASVVQTKLEEAMMWANAGIARSGGPQREQRQP